MMAKVKPQNTVRFAWWGDEEGGLIGSTAYVEGPPVNLLPPAGPEGTFGSTDGGGPGPIES